MSTTNVQYVKEGLPFLRAASCFNYSRVRINNASGIENSAVLGNSSVIVLTPQKTALSREPMLPVEETPAPVIVECRLESRTLHNIPTAAENATSHITDKQSAYATSSILNPTMYSITFIFYYNAILFGLKVFDIV